MSPNPTTGIVIVEMQRTAQKAITVQVIDRQGQVLKTYFFESHEKSLEMDLSNFANGVYFVKFLVAGDVVVEKVIKQ